MVEHRKGLNRALFWLYSGHGRGPSLFRWSMLVFDLVTIGRFAADLWIFRNRRWRK